MELHLDDKILTAWNAWMILAFTALYQLTQEPRYLQAAQNARRQVEQELYQEGRLYVGVRDRRRSGEGFLDDYSAYALALLGLYQATLSSRDLELAMELTQTAIALFYDQQGGGFYTTGRDHEALIFRKKEVYDGAIPSGNSTMAYVLVRLWQITKQPQYETLARRQLEFMAGAWPGQPLWPQFLSHGPAPVSAAPRVHHSGAVSAGGPEKGSGPASRRRGGDGAGGAHPGLPPASRPADLLCLQGPQLYAAGQSIRPGFLRQPGLEPIGSGPGF